MTAGLMPRQKVIKSLIKGHKVLSFESDLRSAVREVNNNNNSFTTTCRGCSYMLLLHKWILAGWSEGLQEVEQFLHDELKI